MELQIVEASSGINLGDQCKSNITSFSSPKAGRPMSTGTSFLTPGSFPLLLLPLSWSFLINDVPSQPPPCSLSPGSSASASRSTIRHFSTISIPTVDSTENWNCKERSGNDEKYLRQILAHRYGHERMDHHSTNFRVLDQHAPARKEKTVKRKNSTP